MTEQVENAKEVDAEALSDEDAYDKEWDDDESSDEGDEALDSESESNSEKASEAETVTDDEVVNSEGDTGTEPEASSPAEGVSADDIWANATEEQKQAYLKAQNDFKSVTGRHKSAEQRAADLEKELQTTKSSLSEATREKGAYEAEHPELFNEVLEAVTRKTVTATQAHSDEQAPDGQEEVADIQAVYKAHKDIDEVMASEEWSSFQSNLSVEQQALYASPDPLDFISLVTEFKVDKAQAAATKASESENLLNEATTTVRGSGSVPDKKVIMSDDDLYNAEWDKDD